MLDGADCAGFAGQHEEGSLEGVFRILDIAQHPLAESENHRPMPCDEHGKGILITLVDEAIQKCRIRGGGGGGAKN